MDVYVFRQPVVEDVLLGICDDLLGDRESEPQCLDEFVQVRCGAVLRLRNLLKLLLLGHCGFFILFFFTFSF